MSSIRKVLIVGGGLGGLSLGIALRRAGMDYLEHAQVRRNARRLGTNPDRLAQQGLGANHVAEFPKPDRFRANFGGTPAPCRFERVRQRELEQVLEHCPVVPCSRR